MANYTMRIKYVIERTAEKTVQANSREEAEKLLEKFVKQRKTGKVRQIALIESSGNQPRSYGGEKSYTQKFQEWHDSLPMGYEYSNKDIARAIGAKTERSMYTIKYAPSVRDVLLREQVSWYNTGVPIGQTICYRKGGVVA